MSLIATKFESLCTRRHPVIQLICCFAGIRLLIVRSLACILGVLLYLAEVTYQDYFNDSRKNNNVTRSITQEELGKQYVCVYIETLTTLFVSVDEM